MDSKLIAIVGGIFVIGILAVGVGYAYAGSLESNSNNVALEDVTISPISGDDTSYVGSTKVVRYSSNNSAGVMTYGIAEDAPLTELAGIKLSYEGRSASMPIYSISFTIDTEMFATDSYYKDSIIIKLTRDGKEWTGTGPYVDQVMHTTRWVFNSTSDDGSTTIVASSTPVEYGLIFTITKDQPNTYPHKEKLSTDSYTITIRASTAAPEHYYLYPINNGLGTPSSRIADDSNHKFAPLDPLSETGYIFGGWFADEALTTPFDFTAPVTSDVLAFAKWTPESYQVELTLGGNTTVKSGSLSQTVDFSESMVPVVITADDGYYFPLLYDTSNDQGLTVTRSSAYQITVSGNITGDKALVLPGASVLDIQALAKSVSDVAFDLFYAQGADLKENISEENWWVYTGINCPKSTNRVAIGGYLFEKNLKTSFQVGTDRIYKDMYAWQSVDGKLYVAVPALYSLTNVNTGIVSIQVESTRAIDILLFDSALNEYAYTVEVQQYEGKPAKTASTSDGKSIVLATTDSRTKVNLLGEVEYGFRFDEGFESFSMGLTPGMLYTTYGYVGWNDDTTMGNSMFTRYYKVVSNTGNYFALNISFIYARTAAAYDAVTFDSTDDLTAVTIDAAYSTNFIDGLSQGLDLNGWDLYVDHDGSIKGTVNTYKSSSVNSVYVLVTFDSQGGSHVDPTYVIRKGSLPPPSNPIKLGSVFEGWYIDSQCTEAYDFNSRVMQCLTLYAKWGEETAPGE